jgi:hypothetical protein
MAFCLPIVAGKEVVTMTLDKLHIPADIADKLQQLALQELRPIKFQAEYMLCRAIQRARLKPEPPCERSQPLEVVHAQAE